MKTKILNLMIALGFICSVFASFMPVAKAAGTVTLTINYQAYSYGTSINNGKVTSSPAGINCGSGGSSCSANFPENSTVTLMANPNSGYKLVHWGWGTPNCQNSNKDNPCVVQLGTSDASIKLTYAKSSAKVSVSKMGDGEGTVTSSPSGINCGSDCSSSFSTFQTINLTASPKSGSKFAGWDTSGTICYSGGGKGGPVAINTEKTCKAYVINDSYKPSLVAKPIFKKVSDGSASSSDASSSSVSTSVSDDSEPEAIKSDESALKNLSELMLNGQKFDPKKTDKMQFDENAPIAFSGKTIPGGIINLYVFSEPKKYAVTADKDGAWSVNVDGLPAGDHHAEIEITDPKTKETSKRSKLLEFSVMSAFMNPVSAKVDSTIGPSTSTKSSNLVTVIAGIVVGLIILVGIFLTAIAYLKPELWAKLKSKFHKPSSTSVEG